MTDVMPGREHDSRIQPNHPPFPHPPIHPPLPQPGPTQVELPPSTLGGAIGCDFRSGLGQLLFVEFSGKLSRMDMFPAPSYGVIGTGYNQPEDVKSSADGIHAYVTERTGDLVKVNLELGDRSTATVIASGMTAPQQLFLDEPNNAAYTVEYAPSGRLLRIDLTTGVQTTVLSGLENAVGVVLSADRQTAYISEQMSGGATGRLSRYQLSNGQRHDLATGLTAPFFLSWMDAGETTLLMPERDPADRLRTVNVLSGTSVVVAAGLPFRPSSAAMAGAGGGQLLVCCDQVIDEIFLAPQSNQPGGNLVEGVGWVPFDWIDQPSGLADTVAHDPAYFYQVQGAPFGGSLPVMVNFAEATSIGATYYRVLVDGNVRTDVFHGAQWDGSEYVAATNAPHTVGGSPGFYTVYTAAEAEQWTALPGCYLDSTNLTGGTTHQITVDFYDATGTTVIASAPPLGVYIDNSPCTATLSAATIGATAATPCGFLQYASTAADVDLEFLAAQPQAHANYSLSLYKGVTNVTGVLPAGSTGGGVPNSSETILVTVNSLLTSGSTSCTTAAFALYLYVAATAQTGWGRCGQYDAAAAEAFMLAP